MSISLRIRRRGKIFALVALVNFFAGIAASADTSNDSLVPFLTNPEHDGAIARADDMIIVIMFEYEDCPWCEYVLRNEIEPIIRSEVYDSSVLFRRVYISDRTEIPSFNGSATSGRQMASGFSVSMSPTLVFLNADGEALASELVGVSSRDFYGYYLEKRIDIALSRLQDSS